MNILVSALEASSNIHLEALINELEKINKFKNNLKINGIFDSKIKTSLGKPDYDITSMAIMGFVDAIKKLPFLLKLNKQMVELSKNADIILLMDASGFNLPLAKKIKAKYPNKHIIYYILPQAWAWKKKRIPKIEKYCDTLCSILPFESDFYTQKQKIHYVGHPLLDEIQNFKSDITNNGLIAFMPGSRSGEISKLLPIYKRIVNQIIGQTDKISIPMLIIPKHFSDQKIEELYGDISMFTISKDTHKTLYEADFAFICSGTATLEASIIGTPFILNYIAKPFDYFIAKNLVKLKYIGLANIFFEKMGEEPIHKEYIQDDVTLENLLDGYKNIDKTKFLENSLYLRKYLQNGSSKTVANIIENYDKINN